MNEFCVREAMRRVAASLAAVPAARCSSETMRFGDGKRSSAGKSSEATEKEGKNPFIALFRTFVFLRPSGTEEYLNPAGAEKTAGTPSLPRRKESLWSFLYYYLRSMRLYYAFVTGSTTAAGILAAHVVEPVPGSTAEGGCGFAFFSLPAIRECLALVIGFLAWGVNQIFNDYGNRKEDARNAPDRPMVNGNLPVFPALLLSCVLMLVFAAAIFLAAPGALIFLICGALLNLLYNFGKKIPIAGCVLYGLSISMCYFFGFFAAGGRNFNFSGGGGYGMGTWIPEGMIFPWMICIILHASMCYFSCFKDMEGDRAVGIRSIPVIFGYRKALLGGMILEGLLLLSFGIIAAAGLPGGAVSGGKAPDGMEGTAAAASVWIAFCAWAITLQEALRLLFLLRRKRLHEATCANCRNCVAQMLLLCCLGMETTWEKLTVLAAIPFSLMMIQLLFGWYGNEKE